MHPHRAGNTADHDFLFGDGRDGVHQFLDSHILRTADIDGLINLGLHQTVNAVHHVVHVGVGADGAPIAPDINGAAILGFRDFAAHGRRRLFAAAAPGAFGPVAVLEPGDPDLDAVLAAIGHGHAFGIEFFPAVLVIRVGG